MSKLVSALFVCSLLGAWLMVPAGSVHAEKLACVASPEAGPPGTTFRFTVSGFSPNTHLWTYAVEPDGTAFSDPDNQGFGGGIKSSAAGNAEFEFSTRFVEVGKVVARAFGPWTLVVQELGPAGTIVREADCRITVTGRAEELEGAALTVSPSQGVPDAVFNVTGTGFGPNEIVNVWLSPPLNCSGFAFDLLGFLTTNAAASAVEWDDVKTNGSGGFSYSIFANTPYFCLGEWQVSARALGSGRGASASFQVVGNTVTLGTAVLSVEPTAGLARGATFTFTGSGFEPNEVIVCYYARPEGTVREFEGYKADGGGNLVFAFTTGFDDDAAGMHYSEGSLGLYTMTCMGQASGQNAVSDFFLMPGLGDP